MEDKILKVAKQAALEAGKIVKKYYQSELTLTNKGHYANFATQADLETEGKIIKILTENFPDHNIIAEESGLIDKNSDYTWAIDPIDGTIPFVDGIPVFGVSIGLIKNNQPIVGVINMVASGEVYWAQIGKGAYLNGKIVKVREENNLQNSTIGIGLGHTDRLMKIDRFLIPFAEKVRYIYLLGSAVSVFSYLTKGMVDGFVLRANIWDVAAGVVLVTEAGGKATDLEGKPLDWSNTKISLVASNGLVHDQILEVLKGKRKGILRD